MKITTAQRSGAAFALALTVLASNAFAARTAQTTKPSQITQSPAKTVAVNSKTPATQTTGPVDTGKTFAGPDYSRALTPQQFNDTYTSWALRNLRIDPAIVHTP